MNRVREVLYISGGTNNDMKTQQTRVDEFQARQGAVAIHEAMLAWSPETGVFAIVRHPEEPDEWEELGLSDTHGACWHDWRRADGAKRDRSVAELLAMLNAELVMLLCRGNASPESVKKALRYVPEWNDRYGEEKN